MKYVSWSALREFFFFGMKSSERTVQMRTIYQVTASHYCVTATVTSVLRLFRTSVPTAASNDTDGTTDNRSQEGSTWEVPGSNLTTGFGYAEVRPAVEIPRAKTTIKAMYV